MAFWKRKKNVDLYQQILVENITLITNGIVTCIIRCAQDDNLQKQYLFYYFPLNWDEKIVLLSSTDCKSK